MNWVLFNSNREGLMSAIGENITELAMAPQTDANGYVAFQWQGALLGFYGMISWSMVGAESLVFTFVAPPEIKGRTFPVTGWTYGTSVTGICDPDPGDSDRLRVRCWLSNPAFWNNFGHAYIHAEGLAPN